jgi:hypothetical protein
MTKQTVQVRFKPTGQTINTIKRVLRAEQIGNFQPIFCTYKGKRTLVKSDAGDLSDPFRRNDSYSKSLFIEVDELTSLSDKRA